MKKLLLTLISVLISILGYFISFLTDIGVYKFLFGYLTGIALISIIDIFNDRSEKNEK